MFEIQTSHAEEAVAERVAAARGQRRARWFFLVLAFAPAFWLFVWAGSAVVQKGGGGGQRGLSMWVWPATGFALTPGLVWIWISSAVLFILLSCMAYLLATTPVNAWKLPAALSGPLILAVALAVRVYVFQNWTPGIDAGIAHDGLQNVFRWHVALIVADLVVVALLMAGLWYQERSVWWAALYAWHPLPLIAVAGNSHFEPVGLAFLAALLLVADPPALPPRTARLSRVRPKATVRWILAPIFALGALAGMMATVMPGWLPGSWGMAFVHERFNGLMAKGLEALVFPDDPQRVATRLMVILVTAEVLVVGLAIWRRWSLGQTLAHAFMVCLLCWPRVYPWYALWPLMAAILARGHWNRAAWVLSEMVLAAYGVHYAGTVRTGQVPLWLLVLEWVPVAVVEGQQLVSDAMRSRFSSVMLSAQPAASMA